MEPALIRHEAEKILRASQASLAQEGCEKFKSWATSPRTRFYRDSTGIHSLVCWKNLVHGGKRQQELLYTGNACCCVKISPLCLPYNLIEDRRYCLSFGRSTMVRTARTSVQVSRRSGKDGVTIIAAVTPALDRYYSMSSALGEVLAGSLEARSRKRSIGGSMWRDPGVGGRHERGKRLRHAQLWRMCLLFRQIENSFNAIRSARIAKSQ